MSSPTKSQIKPAKPAPKSVGRTPPPIDRDVAKSPSAPIIEEAVPYLGDIGAYSKDCYSRSVFAPISALGRELAFLHNRINELEDRLAPVTNEIPAPERPVGEEREVPATDLGRAIDHAVQELEKARERIENLLHVMAL